MSTQSSSVLSPAAAPFASEMFHSPKFSMNPGGLKPVRIFNAERDLKDVFDAVPFTPSQGICTPMTPITRSIRRAMSGQGPEQVASPKWNAFKEAFAESPRATAGRSFEHARVAGGGGVTDFGPAFIPPPMVYAPAYQFNYPIATSYEYMSFPSSPIPAYHQAYIHQPDVNFAWQIGAYMSATQPQPPNGDGFSDGSSDSYGSKKLQHSEEEWRQVYDLSAAICAAHGIDAADPPKDVNELASILVTYHLHNDPSCCSMLLAANKQFAYEGIVKLNSRQRRTLRRAHERAMQAIVSWKEEGAAALGATQAEEAKVQQQQQQQVPQQLPPRPKPVSTHPSAMGQSARVNAMHQRRKVGPGKSRFAPQ